MARVAGIHGVPFAQGAAHPLLRPVEVAEEIHGASGLDGPELPVPDIALDPRHAAQFIVDTVMAAAPGTITLVPTGPLTNIALFLSRYPGLESQLERIVLMGGAIGEGNTTPAAEFNIWVDPEAAQRVFQSGVDITMVGLDVTHQALMTPPHVERLAAAGKAGKLVADLYEFYSQFHQRHYGW